MRDPCPPAEQLSQFALGLVSESDLERIDGHLETCAECLTTLQSLAKSDALVAGLCGGAAGAAGTGGAVPADPILTRLKERLRALPAADLSGLDPTVDVSQPLGATPAPAADADAAEALKTHEVYDFLAPPAAPGELGRLGGYSILRVLGSGGMGVVFEARDPGLERRVALKVLRPALAASTAARTRFLREARAAAALAHDHVMPVYHVSQDGDIPFLVMPLLAGETLEQRLKREGRLSTAEVLRLGRQAAEGLAAAHDVGLVHRDVKPANLWLEALPALPVAPRLKLLDFGLARAADADARVTATGGIVGTAAYMAPEQARGEAVDQRSDLFSLGCVLYRCCTGEAPFKGSNTLSILLSLAQDTPRPPSSVNPHMPPALERLILTLLAKDPGQRPGTARAVADALAAIEPETTSPPTLPEARRQRTRRRLGTALAVVLLGAVVYGLSQIVIVRDQEGNEVARLKVPKRGSVVVQDEPDAPKTVLPGPLQVPEPPPLTEWLKGREVLTVSQDGKGKFKTIQAALDAVKTGQVVKVLDRGPYRETLQLSRPPADIGLISEAQTVLEVAAWKPRVAGEGHTSLYGHHFNEASGFRLAGFALRYTEDPSSWVHVLYWGQSGSSSVVVEDCDFSRSAGTKAGKGAVACYGSFFSEHLPEPFVLRDCRFAGGIVSFLGTKGSAPVLVERCYLAGSAFLGVTGELRQVVVRHNVFENPMDAISCGRLTAPDRLQISNNTFAHAENNVFWGTTPEKGVTIRNNIFRSSFNTNLRNVPVSETHWQVGHNAYFENSGAAGRLKRQPSDLPDPPRFISEDPNVLNYLRVPEDSSAATGGAGGAWPSYVGALPPGPAPKDGDWFSRLRQRWGPLAKESSIPPPISIPEPPPLAEWLKGREVLTVSQDGKGKFKTIQAALNALKPGQVVKVLDRGPYRETLSIDPIPADCGLISEQRTVLEIKDWTDKHSPAKHPNAHFFGNMHGFRLHGFHFLVSEGPGSVRFGMVMSNPNGLVLENCYVQVLEADAIGTTAFMCNWWDSKAKVRPVWVRDCIVRGRLNLSSNRGNLGAVVVVERCFFDRPGSPYNSIHVFGGFRSVVVRHNVFAGHAKAGDITVDASKDIELLEITNNTLQCPHPLLLSKPASTAKVVLHNNLRTHPGLVVLTDNLEKDLAPLIEKWQVSHNALPGELRHGEFGFVQQRIFPAAPGDLVADAKFLSTDARSRDYLRVPSDSPQAKGGAGALWPGYIGALPPGPAPNDGDWFTRLRERWGLLAKESSIPPPTSIPEPPPLVEWLKGREVLTVSQDGKGKFKTIQAALDAVKTGQVIKVLDRGPYKERLLLKNPPKDIGLVSDQPTVVELVDWSVVPLSVWDTAPRDRLYGHVFAEVNGFRVSGFVWNFDAKPNSFAALFFLSPTRLVMEDCAVIGPAAFESRILGVQLSGGGPDFLTPLVVRDCVLVAAELHSNALTGVREPAPAVLIERNYFRPGGRNSGVYLNGPHRKVVVRHNVIVAMASSKGITVEGKEPYDSLEMLEISNNTLSGTGVNQFMAAAPTANVVLRNNVLVPFHLTLGADKEYAAEATRKNWQVSNNSYLFAPERSQLREKVIFDRSTDLAHGPEFLSSVIGDPNYLRLPAESPLARGGAGGTWPDYVGALPAGPAPRGGDWFTRLLVRQASLASVPR